MMAPNRSVRAFLWLIALLYAGAPMSAQVDRSAPPKIGPPPHLRLPPIAHLSLSNGIRVLVMEKHTVPLVQVDVLVSAGATMDPEGRSGLANLTSAMLTEGSGGRDALAFADAVDYLGAQITSGSGEHTTGIDLHCPLAKLDSALVLLADAVRRPAFAPAELERLKKERLNTLLEWRNDPRMLASVIFNRTLYGSHPYGIPTLGSESSIAAITAEDLRKFYTSYFVPANTAIIVVGDITSAHALARLEAAFGKWRGKGQRPPALPPILQLPEKTLLLVDNPGAAQSVIQIGCVGVPRLTEDFYPIVVMNTILGGSFRSRLNTNIREQHGYAYGAGSRFDFRPLAGPFLASASVQTAVTDKALTEFVNELKGIREPVSDEELERAKNYLALGYPAEFQSVEQLASQLEGLVIYGLPDTYFNTYIDRIESVTKEEVHRVAQKYINVDDLAFVIVGDRKEIEEGVSALGLAPAHVLSVEDVLGPSSAPPSGK
ncbi:MAG TPA: pitrilysin family protein [Bacteroidota bacterium]|nr:pitrilysin family protein [Bacteroidota bacterium]